MDEENLFVKPPPLSKINGIIVEKEKMAEDELASTISAVEDNLDEAIEVIDGKDIVQLEILDQHLIRATVGKIKTGKLVKINDMMIDQLESGSESEEKLLRLLCSTPIEHIHLDAETDPTEAVTPNISASNPKYSLQFQPVENGPLGVSVEFVPLPFEGMIGLGLQIQSLDSEAAIKANTLQVGDIILSVNGTSLLFLEKQQALQLLTSTRNRRLIFLRGLSALESRKKEFGIMKEPDEASLRQTMNEFQMKSLERNSFLKDNESLKDPEKEEDVTSIPPSNEMGPTSEWRNIRSIYLCRNVYRPRLPKHFNEHNVSVPQKYRFTSELKTAFRYGQPSYKDLVMKSVESKINIASQE